jgi:hypothetical protein|tara:strand:+ start:831 stop:1028 length:198 start_codon:yes stop_codon:yes gene_type:complete
MKQLTMMLTILFLTSACSIKEPKLSFGKKCEVNDDKITYSYLWLYDKQAGLPATKDQCAALDEQK